MNSKNWIVWVCVALMLLSQYFLYRANQKCDQAQADLRDARHQLLQSQGDLEALKNSSGGEQTEVIANLRKQNEALSTKAAALQKNVERLEKEGQQTAQHLSTARDAIALQEAHLQQLQTEHQESVEVANASACINNLRMIEAAKLQWALEKNKSASDVPTAQDLLPYFKDGAMPVCPDGGSYTINAAGELPACSVTGHILPAQ